MSGNPAFPRRRQHKDHWTDQRIWSCPFWPCPSPWCAVRSRRPEGGSRAKSCPVRRHDNFQHSNQWDGGDVRQSAYSKAARHMREDCHRKEISEARYSSGVFSDRLFNFTIDDVFLNCLFLCLAIVQSIYGWIVFCLEDCFFKFGQLVHWQVVYCKIIGL